MGKTETTMQICVFDTHDFEKVRLNRANEVHHHELTFIEARLTEETAPSAKGFPVVCAFANDRLSAAVLELLAQGGTKLIALRSAGYNHVDLAAARELKLRVVRVPEYSPYAVAEHALALMLTLNRKTHKAYNRVREGNFSLSGLVGFDFHGKVAGVIGVGRIGKALVRSLTGLGCRVLCYDKFPDLAFAAETKCTYASLDTLLERSDVISLHVPLTVETRHLLDQRAFEKMKRGVMLINTGRGALIDTQALIKNLKTGHVGYAGLDVYEEEEAVFFQDCSQKILTDDVLARLMTFPNVLLTGHQGFLTEEALSNIAETTLANVTAFERGAELVNEIKIS